VSWFLWVYQIQIRVLRQGGEFADAATVDNVVSVAKKKQTGRRQRSRRIDGRCRFGRNFIISDTYRQLIFRIQKKGNYFHRRHTISCTVSLRFRAFLYVFYSRCVFSNFLPIVWLSSEDLLLSYCVSCLALHASTFCLLVLAFDARWSRYTNCISVTRPRHWRPKHVIDN